MAIDYVALGFCLSVLAIILTIIVPKFYVPYTIKSQYKENYNAALNIMLEEMRDNYRKMHFFNYFLNEASNVWGERNNLTPASLPKSPSFGLHGFILQFLPSKAYYNFMNRGYYLRLEDGRLEHLMSFYVKCIHFSENTIHIEEEINGLDKSSANFEQQLNGLLQRINHEYLLAMDGFDYHYEGEHGFNPQNLQGLEIADWRDV